MRSRMTVLAVLTASAFLFPSCSVPMYERAYVSRGLSAGLAASAGAGWRVRTWDPEHTIERDPSLGILPSLSLRYGFSNDVGVFLSGELGRVRYFSPAQDYPRGRGEPEFDFRAGVKFRVGEYGALLPSLSLPGVLDIDYLHDFSQDLTGRVGLGFRGLSLGVNYSRPIGKSLRWHAGLTLFEGVGQLDPSAHFLPLVSLGCALEFASEPEEWDLR